MSKVNKEVTEVAVVSYEIDGLSRDNALFALRSIHGLTEKLAKEYYKANKPAKRAGFKERFYAILAEGEMSEKEFDDLIAGESDNVINHKSAHKLVWELSTKIRENA